MDILLRRRKRKAQESSEKSRLSAFLSQVQRARYQKGLMRHFEWPLVIMVLVMSLWGVVSIFAATGSPVDPGLTQSFLEKMSGQSTY